MKTILKQPQPQSQRGISMLEMIIVMSTITILLAFAFVGVTRARASLRLSGAVREFGAYVEKARVDSIRRHADTLAQGAGVSINNDRASYVVSIDFDGNGTLDTRTIQLPAGVTFRTVEAIAFDWRGRTWSTVNGITTSHAQVSITMANGTTSASADVTGSGDVTIDSRVFDDAVPQVRLNVGSLGSSSGTTQTPVTPSPESIGNTGTNVAPPVINPSPITATPTPTAIPTPPVISTPTPTPTPTATATPAATATPTPTPTVTPTPSPTLTPVAQCVLTAVPGSISLSLDGTTTVLIAHTSLSAISISGTSSKSADLQVSPGGSQTVLGGVAAIFTLKSKKSAGTYSATFSGGACGDVTVPVTIK